MTTMIKVKSVDLIGPVLDWAVAKVEGIDVKANNPGDPWPLSVECLLIGVPNYSTDWAQGGPLIDRYQVGVTGIDREHTVFFANAFYDGNSYDSCANAKGPTRLIASMRAIVRLTLGDVVSVPVELMPDTRRAQVEHAYGRVTDLP